MLLKGYSVEVGQANIGWTEKTPARILEESRKTVLRETLLTHKSPKYLE